MTDLPVNVLVVEKYRHRQGFERESSFYACGPVRPSLEEAQADATALQEIAALRQQLAEKDAALAAAALTFEAIRDEPEMADEYALEVLLDSCRALATQALQDRSVARSVELDKARREICRWAMIYFDHGCFEEEDREPFEAACSRLRAMESQ